MQDFIIKTISRSDLPDSLKQLHSPPTQLYLKGNEELLKKTRPKVGIVGARKFTPYGRQVTSDIATAMARAGVTVVSGLALGVDSIAHKACIDSRGQTIAVLPSGIENIYPASHHLLGRDILGKNGLLISEYEGKHRPTKYNFIERNRIIAALSNVLVVTEAAEASGSLHTAGFALEQGVTVMAVPGNITSPYSYGTNKLIQNGAYPILKPEDILAQLGLDGVVNSQTKLAYIPKNQQEQLIINCLKRRSTSTDDLVKTTGLKTSDLQMTMTLMEIEGVVEIQNSLWRLKF